MADNELMEMHKQHRMGQDKYTYFILAVAAAGIAFSIEKTTGQKLSWSMLPLGVAVILWAISFFFGCKNLSGCKPLSQRIILFYNFIKGFMLISQKIRKD